MNILVLSRKGDYAYLKIWREDTLVSGEFTSWALTGPRLLIIANKLHSQLKSMHLTGTYENGAMYAVSYEDMSSILTSILGDDDRTRYEKLRKTSNISRKQFWYDSGYAGLRFAGLTLFILYKTFTFIIIQMIMPLIINFFTKKR